MKTPFPLALNPSPLPNRTTHSTLSPLAPCNLVTVVTLLTILFCGCTAPRPLKGGRALTSPKGSGLEQTLVQSENPAQATKQDQQTIKVRTYTLPAGSRIESPASSPPTPSAFPTPNSELRTPTTSQPSTLNSQPSVSFLLSSPMPVTEREETRANTELGPAQKDTARELGAKLASLKSIVWAGLALFLLGLGTLFYPPLRALINSVTTSLALTLGGLALIILPTLIVGHELFLLTAVLGLIAAWFLAHRHGQLRGSLQSQPVPVRVVPATPSTTSN